MIYFKKNLLATISIILAFFTENSFSQLNNQRDWGTYFGNGTLFHHASATDSNNNLYIAGYVRNFTDVPVYVFNSSGTHQTSYGGGVCDGFLVKFNPQGQMVWGTYLGGSGDDFIYGIAIDSNDNIFCVGTTTSNQNIATSNAFQPNLNGTSDVFLTKLTTDGTIVWSTYYGGTNNENGNTDYNSEETVNCGIVIDYQDNVYIFNNTQSTNLGTIGNFQPNKQISNYLISKFSNSGNRIWATYYGENGSRLDAIAIGSTGLVVAGRTNDCPPFYTPSTYFATPGCHQPTPSNCSESYVTKFNLNGERLWSTYYGGNVTEFIFPRTGNVLCLEDDIYYAATTTSSNNIATPGSFQETKGTSTTHFLVKFNASGQRQWSTYSGYSTASGFDGKNMAVFLNKSEDNNIFLSGSTTCDSNISTLGSYQETKSGGLSDSYIVKFSPEGEKIEGTYYGGNSADFFGKIHRLQNNSFYLVGSTQSTNNIASENSFQPNFINDGVNPLEVSNIYLAKFSPNPLSTAAFEERNVTLYPNPNHGSFYLSFPEQFSKVSLRILDALGKCVHTENDIRNRTLVRTDSMAKGMYFVAISHEKNTVMKKIIVN